MIPSKYKTEIIQLIEQGKRPTEISKELNLNKTSVNSYIKYTLGCDFSRTYPVNSEYFKLINEPMKAYWLGFIAADGYLVEAPSKVVGITITESDKEILENFKTCIETNRPILNIKPKITDGHVSKPFVRLHIGNKIMYQDLINLGITKNKSKTLVNILENVPYQYRDAFIIGYFDGDGSVLLPKGKVKKSNNKYYPSHSTVVSIRGTKELLEGINSHLGLNKHLVHSGTYVLNIAKKEHIIRFVKCYSHLNFFLRRKFDKLISRFGHPSYDKIIQAQTISSPYPYGA